MITYTAIFASKSNAQDFSKEVRGGRVNSRPAGYTVEVRWNQTEATRLATIANRYNALKVYENRTGQKI